MGSPLPSLVPLVREPSNVRKRSGKGSENGGDEKPNKVIRQRGERKWVISKIKSKVESAGLWGGRGQEGQEES